MRVCGGYGKKTLAELCGESVSFDNQVILMDTEASLSPIGVNYDHARRYHMGMRHAFKIA